jgi:hypothetical protein
MDTRSTEKVMDSVRRSMDWRAALIWRPLKSGRIPSGEEMGETPTMINCPTMIQRFAPDLATFLCLFGFVLNLQSVDALVSITAGLVAIAAGGWALWDRWKRRKTKSPAE